MDDHYSHNSMGIAAMKGLNSINDVSILTTCNNFLNTPGVKHYQYSCNIRLKFASVVAPISPNI